MRLLSVVLNSGDRWSDSGRLLDYGFGNYRVAQVAKAGETIVMLPASGATDVEVPLVCATDLFACLPRYTSGVWIDLEIPKFISAPCPSGSVLGRALLKHGEDVVGRSDLVAGRWVNKRTPAGDLIRALSSLTRFFVAVGIL